MMEYSLIAALVAVTAITTLTLVGKGAGSAPAVLSCYMCVQRLTQADITYASFKNETPAGILLKCRVVYDTKPKAGSTFECTKGFY